MMVVRSVQTRDLDAVLALANETGPGLTTLKPDRAALAARIDRIVRTVRGEAALHEQGYLFVMEDTATHEVVGVCGLEAAVGLELPFYNYRVSTVVHASKELNVWSRTSLLTISHDLTGYAELCSLFLSPRARAHGAGGLLSRSRFMFIAQFLNRFPERICAEMRGYFDENGESPFWQALGSHFYQIDFNAADYLSAQGKKAFIAELMPRHPVYVRLLPAAAQQAIGVTHKDTLPARRMLEGEGLRYENHVDIFDAGPVLECHTSDLRTVRASRVLAVGPAGDDAPEVKCLVSNLSIDDFRVIAATVRVGAATVALDAEQSAALKAYAGAQVRVLVQAPAPAAPATHAVHA
ncbi:MAG TPA: arginine N-succinyltransferase [Pararobbsia sp.]|jgi:arginine N-succinyltransferase|nr:arginine N-succinyltransferase [Pararobbsia sp.]